MLCTYLFQITGSKQIGNRHFTPSQVSVFHPHSFHYVQSTHKSFFAKADLQNVLIILYSQGKVQGKPPFLDLLVFQSRLGRAISHTDRGRSTNGCCCASTKRIRPLRRVSSPPWDTNNRQTDTSWPDIGRWRCSPTGGSLHRE